MINQARLSLLTWFKGQACHLLALFCDVLFFDSPNVTDCKYAVCCLSLSTTLCALSRRELLAQQRTHQVLVCVRPDRA